MKKKICKNGKVWGSHNSYKKKTYKKIQSKLKVYNKNSNWKGGKIINSLGYVLICCPTHPNRNRLGYVMEHRLVMEKHIGRTLLPSEIVHHINNNVSDNRIENLMLFENNSKHISYHNKIRGN